MKKKPSEPLIIGGKRYYKYKIVWEDIVGDSTLATANDFAKMTCADVHTECWIFDKTDDYFGKLTKSRYPGIGQSLVGSLTGAVAS